jgi:hypothetical protein
VTQGLIAAGVALACAVAVTNVALSTQAVGARFSLTPASQTVDPNATAISVDVTLADAANVTAWEFQLSYNNNVVDFVSASPDPAFLESSGKPVHCPSVNADEDAGKVILGCLVLQPAEGAMSSASGGGKLATLTFNAKHSGKSPLVFTKLELSDATPEFKSLTASGGTGMIKVSGGGESDAIEPTPTVNPLLLTPTVPAGATLPEQVDPNDPNLGAGSSVSGSGGTAGSGGSGNSSSSNAASGSGSVAGSMASSGAGGSQNAASGTTGPDGAPVAGYGSLEERAAWARFAFAGPAIVGIACIAWGYAASRRRLGSSQGEST